MGASLITATNTYNIVTNPVKAQSLYSRLKSSSLPPLDKEYTICVAKQLSNAMGYLHAKDIVHGRISSRNVFLEGKIQLSLLDYAVGIPNTVYSSPMVLSEKKSSSIFRGKDKADDVFAFGTLLFELFSAQLPFSGDGNDVIEAKIR